MKPDPKDRPDLAQIARYQIQEETDKMLTEYMKGMVRDIVNYEREIEKRKKLIEFARKNGRIYDPYNP